MRAYAKQKDKDMTLKISRFLTDAINKQAKISHFDYSVSVGKPDKMKAEWKEKLLAQFGELFLNDANYVIMTKVDGTDEKLVKKFTDLISTVLDTEIPSSDVKKLDLGIESKKADPDDEDNEKVVEEPASDVVLLVKLTTK